MNGLNDTEVIESRKKYGSNSINVKNENKFFRLLLESLGDPIIKIMLIALAIRIIFMFSSCDWYETIGMLLSIFLSSLISSLSEYGSNKAFKRLQEESKKIKVRVKRNGVMTTVDNDDIVVGDLVYLESGESIPADGKIVSGSIGVDEKAINGETKEVIKNYNDNVFKGSICVSDSAIMKVLRVGVDTIYGNIALELNEKQPDSPMKIRLRELAKVISIIGYIGAILVSLSYLFNIIVIENNFDWNIILNNLSNLDYVIDKLVHAIILSLTIILVAVPEGLPMMVALVLSSNMKRMLKNNVLVRKLVGIETSGSLNVLLTDKTGTLTKGNLNVIGIIDAENNFYNNIDEMSKELKEIYSESLIYNNASSFDNGKIIGGNITDKAILKYIGYHEKNKKIIKSTSFNSKNKYSYVLLDNNNSYYKGATEVLLPKCDYYLDKNNYKKILKNKDIISKNITMYTKRGMRVICLIKNNILLGFILISDEIRPEANKTLEEIKNAGIHTIMITGDDLQTAKYIANELKMLESDSLVINHDQLSSMSDQDIILNYKKIKVIARALPKDKSRMASVLESNSLVVGMTGDGVNDAPALKKANVGFAMGSGSEVAKEAADIVILDDNIQSISNAILYGRTIFKSIRKFIIFQLTMNFCALFLSIVGPFIGITSPVTVMQMLWINMIMDTFAGVAYSYEYPLKRYMKDLPIKKNEKIMNKYMYYSIIFIGIYASTILVLFLKTDIFSTLFRNSEQYYMTAFFSIFIFMSIFNAFNARTTRINIFSGLLKNKVFIFIMLFIFIAQIILIYYGGELFRTYGLTFNELMYSIIISLTVIPIDIVKKIFIKYR